MKRNELGSGCEGEGVNVSPLVDMVFILLVFFVVTAVFVTERGLRAETPDPEPPIVRDVAERIEIELRTNGELRYEGRPLELDAVAALMRRENPTGEATVALSLAKDASAGAAVALMDRCRGAGARRIQIRSTW